MIKPHRWDGRTLQLLDQRRLPQRLDWVTCSDAREVAAAIRDMVVRGAPAIGVAAAYGLAMEAQRLAAGDRGGDGLPAVIAELEQAAQLLAGARPTAVNLSWAIERMRPIWLAAEVGVDQPSALAERLTAEAEAIDAEDVAMNRAIADHGRPLLAGVSGVLTHCNTGGLATAGIGTALGMIRAAAAEQPLRVYACETRPYLQGSRLTAWELSEDGIDVTLITDGAAAHVIASGRVQAVVTGADRIAANGDVANKIGTYGLAIIARHHGVPFYVAAPRSTVDLGTPDGAAIEIELRDPAEVTHFRGEAVAPPGVKALNPAFDVTPAHLITAIVTDAGVAHPPYERSLTALAAPGFASSIGGEGPA